MKALVIGLGSAGERHVRNLVKLGIEVSVYDTNADIFRPNIGLPDITTQITKFEALNKELGINFFQPSNYFEKFDMYIICTPPDTHMKYIVEGLQHYVNIFVEKPISDSSAYLDWVGNTVRSNDLVLQVGYQLRYDRGLRMLKDFAKSSKVYSIEAEFGSYLPNWHPGEDYTKLYAGHKKDGGGIILDASHEIDYVMWLANSEVVEVSSMCSKRSNLDIDVEDTAEINLLFANGIIGHIHVDMTNRIYTRKCKVISEGGTEEWHYPEKVVVNYNPKGEALYCPYMEEDLYFLEMQSFIGHIRGKTKSDNDAENAQKVLEVALKAKQGAKGCF